MPTTADYVDNAVASVRALCDEHGILNLGIRDGLASTLTVFREKGLTSLTVTCPHEPLAQTVIGPAQENAIAAYLMGLSDGIKFTVNARLVTGS